MKNILLRILPAYLVYLYMELRYLFVAPRRSYSQFGEDLAAANLIRTKKGVYVDIGACHPIRYSNTYLFYKKGWKGINIDISPYSKSRFDIVRPKDTNVTLGIGNAGERLYYLFSNPLYNTCDDEQAREVKDSKRSTLIKTMSVKIVPLKEALSKQNVGEIDFMNIDVEGMDLEVLKSNDWDTYRPKVIAIESWNFYSNNPC